jgi:hypothetical protein
VRAKLAGPFAKGPTGGSWHQASCANTVRTHVKCIYGKLGAHGRIEAIQRAQELGLLP